MRGEKSWRQKKRKKEKRENLRGVDVTEEFFLIFLDAPMEIFNPGQLLHKFFSSVPFPPLKQASKHNPRTEQNLQYLILFFYFIS